MRRIQILVCALFLSGSAFGSSGWETDFDKALSEAKASNRYLLLDFTGSDWCGWCIKLDNEVFSQSEFKKYAKEQLVLVELDFPRKKSLSSKLQTQNEALLQKYGVRGFPTILILSPSGDLVQKTGYRDGGADAYVEHLTTIVETHRSENKIPAPGLE